MDGIVAIFGIVSALAVIMLVRNTINFMKEGKQDQGTREQASKASVNDAKTATVIDKTKVNTEVKQGNIKPESLKPETQESNPAKPKTIHGSSDITQIPISVQGSVDGDGERIARIESILGKYVEGGSEAKE